MTWKFCTSTICFAVNSFLSYLSLCEFYIGYALPLWQRLGFLNSMVHQMFYCSSMVSLYKDCPLQVKYPQAVLPPALGTSMYAIACILSYDGLPSVLADAVLEPQPSGRDAADPGRPFQGRRLMGFIPPGGFLRSLISDKVQGSPSHKDRKANLINPVSAHSISHSPVRSPFPGPGSGSSAPRIRSFKRRR